MHTRAGSQGNNHESLVKLRAEAARDPLVLMRRIGCRAILFMSEEQQRITQQWEEHDVPVELHTLYSPYRELSRPILRYVDDLDDRHDDDFVTVVVPEFSLEHWWQKLLHNQSALILRTRLRARPNTVVTSVPFHLDRSLLKGQRH